MTVSRSSIAAGAAALALALSASPALAQGGSGGGGGGTGGGGGGGGSTQPAPAPTGDAWSLCPEYATTGFFTQADGSTLFARNNGGLLSIYEIRSGAGWVPSIKSSDPQKLDVQWTWPATGEKHQITVQPGKTVVR
jgi:hypothetical protein